MSNSWYVYLVRCNDNSIYCGITNNLQQRMDKHHRGVASKYTRVRLPVELVWYQEVNNKSTALRLEHAIKKLPKLDKEILICQFNY